MLTLLEQIDKGTLWHSPGGIHPPELKSLSNQMPSSRIEPAKQYRIPLPQVGDCARLSIKVGDKVLQGQQLTEGEGFMYLPVHSPISGMVSDISLQSSNHASGLPTLTCIIESDGQNVHLDYQTSVLEALSNQQILDKIKQAGIAGMGGATFPSHIKLNPASEIDLVIINGVECEPYITSDDILMREYALEIFKGIQVINKLLSPQRIIIAIEDNKPQACKSMQQCLSQFDDLNEIVKITVIPTKYPSGGEKQLIQIITGKEVPTGSIPAQQGIVVHNVGTAYAIQDAVLNGKPLIERLVTLTGQQVSKPGNYWLAIGTSVDYALAQVGFTEGRHQKVIIGGPMMGYALPDYNVPVLKGTNCILAPSANEIAPEVDEKACIRCGECAIACPALLLPQQLFWHSKAEEYDKAASFNLKDCIECGCCSFVCPSDIPLVEYYRIAKSALKNEAEEKLQAEQAKIRFEARLKRLDDEKQAREEKSKLAAEKRKAASNASSNKNTVAEAMARVAAKKKAAEQENIEDKTENGKSAAVKAAIERAKAKKLAGQSQKEPDSANVSAGNDKKAQIAAAVARAKAKKLALAQSNEATDSANPIETVATEPVSSQPVDDKKAKIAAAVARAKAKKLALAQSNEATDSENPTETVATEPDDDKKAKIAAAVARAKAKKLASAQSDEATDSANPSETVATEPVSSQPVDDKKAKIAAAVARAKAKKLALAKSNEATDSADNPTKTVTTESVPTDLVDDKKAKIAAAVARAKAKKLAKQNNEVSPEEQETATQIPISEGSAVNTEVAITQNISDTSQPVDDKKARIAAAVAKAKAKKSSKSENVE